jgi:hypothetical protein
VAADVSDPRFGNHDQAGLLALVTDDKLADVLIGAGEVDPQNLPAGAHLAPLDFVADVIDRLGNATRLALKGVDDGLLGLGPRPLTVEELHRFGTDLGPHVLAHGLLPSLRLLDPPSLARRSRVSSALIGPSSD